MTGHPELTGRWRKSVRSAANEACVEVAPLRTGTAVRDAKHPTGPMLTFTSREWSTFARGVKAGRHHLA